MSKKWSDVIFVELSLDEIRIITSGLSYLINVCDENEIHAVCGADEAEIDSIADKLSEHIKDVPVDNED